MAMRDIPEKTDDSLGRVKSVDTDRPFPKVFDLDHEVHPDELERMKDAIIANAAGVVDALDWHFFDDFIKAPTTIWKQTLAGAGAVAELDGASADADSGVGWVQLSATAGGDAAAIRHDGEFVRGDHSPTFRARVKIPTNAADGLPVIGLYSAADAGATQAVLEVTGAGDVWKATIASDVGTGSTNVTTAVEATAGWHDVRIEVINSAIVDGVEIEVVKNVKFYVDDVLIATLLGSANVPQGADRMAPRFALTYGQGSGAVIVVDWVDVRGLR